jgi:hypothetical protein
VARWPRNRTEQASAMATIQSDKKKSMSREMPLESDGSIAKRYSRYPSPHFHAISADPHKRNKQCAKDSSGGYNRRFGRRYDTFEFELSGQDASWFVLSIRPFALFKITPRFQAAVPPATPRSAETGATKAGQQRACCLPASDRHAGRGAPSNPTIIFARKVRSSRAWLSFVLAASR